MSAGDVTSSLEPERLDGFAVHHGIRIASIGEDDDTLLMGHHDPETAWAAFASYQVALGNWSTPAYEPLEHYEVRQAFAAFSHHSEGCDNQAQQVCGPCAAEDHDACVSPCLCEDDYDHDDEGPSASPAPCSCEDEYAWWVTATKTGHPVTWISWDWKAARERSVRPARPTHPRRPTVADDLCTCPPDGSVCLGLPGESDACESCRALDPEEPCLHDPDVYPKQGGDA